MAYTNSGSNSSTPSSAPPSSSTLVLNIPFKLVPWARSAESDQVLREVVSKTGVTQVLLQELEEGKANYLIEGQTLSIRARAKALLEVHFSYQVDFAMLKEMQSRKRPLNDEEIRDLASGRLVEFYVQTSVVGLVIGKGGANVDQIIEAFDLDDIHVVNKTGLVRVRGNDPEAVAKARKTLSLRQVSIPLQRPLKSRMYSGLRDKSGAIAVHWKDQRLYITGSESKVELARVLLETQLRYEDRLTRLQGHSSDLTKEMEAIAEAYSALEEFRARTDKLVAAARAAAVACIQQVEAEVSRVVPESRTSDHPEDNGVWKDEVEDDCLDYEQSSASEGDVPSREEGEIHEEETGEERRLETDEEETPVQANDKSVDGPETQHKEDMVNDTSTETASPAQATGDSIEEAYRKKKERMERRIAALRKRRALNESAADEEKETNRSSMAENVQSLDNKVEGGPEAVEETCVQQSKTLQIPEPTCEAKATETFTSATNAGDDASTRE